MKPSFFSSAEIPYHGFGFVKFEFSEKSKETIIDLDLDKTINYWRDNKWYQRSAVVTSYNHDLPFDVEITRLCNLMGVLKEGKTLPPVSLHLGYRDSICFPDGRHRIVLLFLAGYTSIVASVKKEESKQIFKVLGTDTPDLRMSVLHLSPILRKLKNY